MAERVAVAQEGIVMRWWLSLYGSAVGKKAVMAVSGIVLFGFVLVHMLGNMKLYLGPEAYNHYAVWLREVGAPALPHESALWIFRIVLLVCVVLHIHAAYRLTVTNWRARPVGYDLRETLEATYAARTMRWGGVIVALFVFFHLANLTWGWKWAHPDFVAGDVYHNVVTTFRVWWIAAVYIVAQVALGFHLYHGLWSMFQSLGWNHPRYNLARRRFAQVFAWVITLGNISFPLSVLLGLVN
jgi:succinate dehydrogenase / fumarate reductase cytochrome b subunit